MKKEHEEVILFLKRKEKKRDEEIRLERRVVNAVVMKAYTANRRYNAATHDAPHKSAMRVRRNNDPNELRERSTARITFNHSFYFFLTPHLPAR